jgi:hypothetical protein
VELQSDHDQGSLQPIYPESEMTQEGSRPDTLQCCYLTTFSVFPSLSLSIKQDVSHSHMEIDGSESLRATPQQRTSGIAQLPSRGGRCPRIRTTVWNMFCV